MRIYVDWKSIIVFMFKQCKVSWFGSTWAMPQVAMKKIAKQMFSTILIFVHGILQSLQFDVFTIWFGQPMKTQSRPRWGMIWDIWIPKKSHAEVCHFFRPFGMIPTNFFGANEASAKRRASAIEAAAAQKRIAQMQEGFDGIPNGFDGKSTESIRIQRMNCRFVLSYIPGIFRGNL